MAEVSTADAKANGLRPAFWPSALLAAAAGILDFVAFPGIGVWPLAFVALVPLFFALEATVSGGASGTPDAGHSGWRAWWLGVIYGSVGNLGGFYWLIDMLENFSGFPVAVCVLFAVVVCVYQGGMLALFAWLWFRTTRRGWPSLVAGPAAFAAVELTWPLLFPYYHGAHLHNVPLLVQGAELGGPILLTCLIVAVNVVVHQVIRARWRRQRLPRRNMLVVATVVSGALLFGAIRLSQVETAMANSPKRMVGLVQVSMGIFEKRRNPREGLRRHIQDSLELIEDGDIDLLVWPESAYSSLLPPNTDNVQPYVMGPLKVPLLFGGLRMEVDPPQGQHKRVERRLYNTAFLTDAAGNVVGRYDKTFLMAFGEYMPLGDVFPVLYEWSPNSGGFTPGNHVEPLRWGDYRISALICYEDIVPRFTRRAVAEGNPHLLVSIANDAWFGDTTAPWQHLALAQLRAVEHRRFLVRSTNSGVSALVDATGTVTKHSAVFTREVLRGQVRLMDGWTLYQSVGDWPGYLGLVLIVWMGFVRRRQRLSVE